MDINYTNFCFKKVEMVDGPLKEKIIGNVFKNNYLHNIQTVKECKDLSMLNEHYLISENIQNSSVFVLFLTTINKVKYSFMIEYKVFGEVNVYKLFLRFDSFLYDGRGTMFFGDLVFNDKECWNYLISDILFYKGKPVYLDSLYNKITLITDILKKNYVYDDFMNPFHIKLRSFMTLNHIDIDLFSNDTELIFYPNDSRMDKLIVKIVEEEESKTETQETYLVKKDTELPDIYKIYDSNMLFVDILTVKTITVSKELKKLFSEETELTLELVNDNNEWFLK